MMIGTFLDRASRPGVAEMVESAGPRRAMWASLAGWVESAYGVEPETLFYGKDSGWVVRYRRGAGRSSSCCLTRAGCEPSW